MSDDLLLDQMYRVSPQSNRNTWPRSSDPVTVSIWYQNQTIHTLKMTRVYIMMNIHV